jgi:TfoX/Sxy family transcriptional regulator of competence genes
MLMLMGGTDQIFSSVPVRLFGGMSVYCTDVAIALLSI